MSGASRGIYLERRVAEILAKRGWFTIRAAGSHGIADVVAVAPATVAFIQAKTDGAIRGLEWNRLWEVAGTYGAVPVVAQYGTRSHRAIIFVEITGPHKPRTREWPNVPWHPHVIAAPRLDEATAEKVAELELERLNAIPPRMP
jgi:Holliday junction resolvase